MDDEKWILNNNVERTRLWDKWNELPPTIPKTRLHPKKGICVCSGNGRESSIMSSFQKTKWLSLTVLDPIRPTESSTWWQTSRISQQKMHTFCQSNARLHVSCLVFDDQARTVTAWLGSSDSSPAFSQTLHFCIPSYLVFTKGKEFNSLEDCKSHCEQFFSQKIKSFRKTEWWKCIKKW